MVPIHDSDLAAERWSKAEWENYELWEKVELKLKRKRRLWIFATVVVFTALSAVPIVMDRWPKWRTRTIVRHLAQEMNRIKREASIDRSAYRIRFTDDNKLLYVVERVPNCTAVQGEVIRTGAFVHEEELDEFYWISPEKGQILGVPGLISDFCYDYLLGSSLAAQPNNLSGIGVIPASDLTLKRIDRATLLILSGTSAEISFD